MLARFLLGLVSTVALFFAAVAWAIPWVFLLHWLYPSMSAGYIGVVVAVPSITLYLSVRISMLKEMGAVR